MNEGNLGSRSTKRCEPTMSAEMPPVVAVAAAVERRPISKRNTDRLGMCHKLPRLKSGVPAGGFRREFLCIAPFLIRSQSWLQAWGSSC